MLVAEFAQSTKKSDNFNWWYTTKLLRLKSYAADFAQFQLVVYNKAIQVEKLCSRFCKAMKAGKTSVGAALTFSFHPFASHPPIPPTFVIYNLDQKVTFVISKKSFSN